ncbi:DUF962 domain-containing protein [Shewanella sp. AS1]|uniref:Mpo1 family 2-hydroxy fatty acid dioxygenase n=1 Tax=Shewanella sp. AS1 TaxID=2907626 RepID=UPI001F246CB6|nr:Mpo1-like protein [Shewanella sp. AS1]MCE9677970.1 DUF962 domain-containing protein [Shewanella sp. AS1]
MKSAVEQLATYKSVHLNASNIKSHFVGIPLIIWSLFVVLNLIPFNLTVDLAGFAVSMDLANIFTLVVLIYYFKLHFRLALGLLLFILPVNYTAQLAAQTDMALWIATGVFVIGWIFQLIGHQYERAKPAFVDDINQLLIGPFFLMAEIYFALGWESELNQTITPLAREKRAILDS